MGQIRDGRDTHLPAGESKPDLFEPSLPALGNHLAARREIPHNLLLLRSGQPRAAACGMTRISSLAPGACVNLALFTSLT